MNLLQQLLSTAAGTAAVPAPASLTTAAIVVVVATFNSSLITILPLLSYRYGVLILCFLLLNN